MRKINIYLTLLLFLICSCTKEDAVEPEAVEIPNQELSANGFYKVGDRVEIKDQSLAFSTNDMKTSYLEEIPYAGLIAPPLVKNIYKSHNLTNNGNEIARSNNGLYSMLFQDDGNLVLYRRNSQNGNIDYQNPLWAANSLPPFSPGLGFRQINFAPNGNVICFAGPNAYWASGTATSGPNLIWMLQDDGNFVGYSNHRRVSLNPITVIEFLGPAFAATNTQTGRKSPTFGSLYIRN